MRQLTTAADRIDCWIRRLIVTSPSYANPARDPYIGLTTAVGRSLKDQYDAAMAPMPSPLAALVRRLEAR
jgi:hypothetical protein